MVDYPGHTASIISLEGKLNKQTANIVIYFACCLSPTQKTEIAASSKTSVNFYQIIWRHILEDSMADSDHRHETIKFHLSRLHHTEIKIL
jgi:hypothetical protein